MKKILVISTDENLLSLLRSQVTALGFEISTIDTNQHLAEQVKLEKPAVLIIDFLLGDDNAAAVCHQITASPDTSDIPVVILSDMPGIEQTAAKAGSFAVIKKPMSVELLAENIMAALLAHKV